MKEENSNLEKSLRELEIIKAENASMKEDLNFHYNLAKDFQYIHFEGSYLTQNYPKTVFLKTVVVFEIMFGFALK